MPKPARAADVRNGAVAVAVGLGSTWLLATFLRSRGDEWPAAIQAISTLALLIVTYRYVILTAQLASMTERLARSQERPLEAIRLQIAEASTRKIGQLLARDSWRLQAYARDIASACAKDPPDLTVFKIEEGVHIRELSDAIEAAMFEVPSGLVDRVGACVAALLRAQVVNTAAIVSVQEETTASKSESRPFDPARVETHWTVHARPAIQGKPEWSTVIGGDQLLAAKAECDRLRTAIGTYLLASDGNAASSDA
jgi:hypothetical protein